MATSTKRAWRITEEKWNYKTRVTQTVKEQLGDLYIFTSFRVWHVQDSQGFVG